MILSVMDSRPRNIEGVRVQNLIPSNIQESSKNLVSFIEYYYEYLNSVGLPSAEISSIISNKDIDDVSAKYISSISATIAKTIPNSATIDDVELYKIIVKYYNTRGSDDSISTFFKLFLNEIVTVSYPRDYMFDLSMGSGKWTNNIYAIDANGNEAIVSDYITLTSPPIDAYDVMRISNELYFNPFADFVFNGIDSSNRPTYQFKSTANKRFDLNYNDETNNWQISLTDISGTTVISRSSISIIGEHTPDLAVWTLDPTIGGIFVERKLDNSTATVPSKLGEFALDRLTNRVYLCIDLDPISWRLVADPNDPNTSIRTLDGAPINYLADQIIITDSNSTALINYTKEGYSEQSGLLGFGISVDAESILSIPNQFPPAISDAITLIKTNYRFNVDGTLYRISDDTDNAGRIYTETGHISSSYVGSQIYLLNGVWRLEIVVEGGSTYIWTSSSSEEEAQNVKDWQADTASLTTGLPHFEFVVNSAEVTPNSPNRGLGELILDSSTGKVYYCSAVNPWVQWDLLSKDLNRYWSYSNSRSFASNEYKLQDSYYLQRYSYLITTETDPSVWKDSYLNFVHPAGLQLFVGIIINSLSLGVWNSELLFELNDPLDAYKWLDDLIPPYIRNKASSGIHTSKYQPGWLKSALTRYIIFALKDDSISVNDPMFVRMVLMVLQLTITNSTDANTYPRYEYQRWIKDIDTSLLNEGFLDRTIESFDETYTQGNRGWSSFNLSSIVSRVDTIFRWSCSSVDGDERSDANYVMSSTDLDNRIDVEGYSLSSISEFALGDICDPPPIEWSDWSPNAYAVCVGETFAQTRYNTDNEYGLPRQYRQTVGASIADWSDWYPLTSSICAGVQFTQIRDDMNGICSSEVRTAMGISFCELNDVVMVTENEETIFNEDGGLSVNESYDPLIYPENLP